MKKKLDCSHCKTAWPWKEYVIHVKYCLTRTMFAWNAAEHSKAYYEQARAQSRYAQPGDPKRRSALRKLWSWSTIRADGPVLMEAENMHRRPEK